MTKIASLDTLGQIIEKFDGFIVDQFGVLHDGHQAYPEAVATLKLLINAGKRVIILSNSGKRSQINIRRMASLGFERSLYNEFVTSGDVAFEMVKSRYAKINDPESEAKENGSIGWNRTRCLLIARDGDVSAIEGLELEIARNAEEADLVMISASEGDRYSEQHYIDLLRDAAHLKVPCLCTNPDKLMLTRQGIKFGAGRIAELYEVMGGRVEWIGKPYKPVYDHAMQYFQAIDRQRILCVGDSIEHDIAGGFNVGLKTLLILGGIHQQMASAQLAQYMQTHNAVPDFTLNKFK